jgi:hypothetical protein
VSLPFTMVSLFRYEIPFQYISSTKYIFHIPKIFLTLELLYLNSLIIIQMAKKFTISKINYRRSQWLRRLLRGSTTACLLVLWVRIPPGDLDICLL